MLRTRYGWPNLTILGVGTLLCMAVIPYTGLVFASVHAPAGVKTLCADLVVLCVVLVLPAFLLGWRWPRIAANTLWTLTFLVVVFSVSAGELLPMLIPVAAVGGVSGLASWVEANCARAARLESK